MIRLDAEKRRALAEAQKRVAELLDPIREEKRIQRAKSRRNREKAIDRKAEGQRKPRERDNTYLKWVRRLPCIECVRDERATLKPSQAAHIRAGYPDQGWRPTGMQEKPSDSRVAPLCAEHHTDGPGAQHKAGERHWWSSRDIYPPDLCRALRAAYDAGQPGEPVIRSFAQSRNPK